MALRGLRLCRRSGIAKCDEEVGNPDRAVARRQRGVALMLRIEVRCSEQDRRPRDRVTRWRRLEAQHRTERKVFERFADRRYDIVFGIEKNADHSGDCLAAAIDARDEAAEPLVAQIVIPVPFLPAQAFELEDKPHPLRIVVPAVDNIGSALLDQHARRGIKFADHVLGGPHAE